MGRKEIKATAKDCIRGNKGTYFGITLVLSVILSALTMGLSAIGIAVGEGAALIFSALTGIISLVYTCCITLSMTKVGLNLYDKGYIQFSEAWYGFKHMGGALTTYLWTFLWTWIWSLLFIIPGIVKSYSYALAMFIKADVPSMSARECLKQSKQIMKGNKMKLFIQDLSFFGWGLLVAPTFGLILIWLVPYMQAARAGFYRELVGQQG